MNPDTHILALEGWPTLLAGGQERSLFEVVGGLRKRGITFTLAYEEEGDLIKKYQDMGIETFQISTRRVTLKSRNAPRNLWNFVVSVLRVLKCSRKKLPKWNLIYVNQYFDLPLAVICGMMLKIPVICHLRLAAPHYLSRQYGWGLHRSRLLICNSHFTARSYQEKGIPGEKMAVVHNAIDIEEFSPADPEVQDQLCRRPFRQILYLGRIAPTKGLEILVEAVALARKTDDRLRLLIVGNSRGDTPAANAIYRQQLHDYSVARLGNAVAMRPATPHVVELYRFADLVVLPSIWEEPFGRVVIEAMACGIPCLASRVGGIPEILGGGFDEMLFERKNFGQLTSLILKNIDWRQTNPALANRVREKIVSTFNAETMREKIFTMFCDIAGNS